MKRRFFFPVLSMLAVIVVFLIALELHSPRTRGSITLYSAQDLISPAVLKDFTMDTGIEVNLVITDRSGADPVSPAQCDLLFTELPCLQLMDSLGQLKVLDGERLSASEEQTSPYYRTIWQNTGGTAVPALWTTMGLLHNSTASGVQVKGWANLFDPEYPGVIAITGNHRKGLAAALLSQRCSLRSPRSEDLLAAVIDLKGHSAISFQYSTITELEEAFRSGSVSLATCYAGQAIPIMEDNPQLSFVIPGEGSWQTLLCYAIPSQCQQEEEAYALLNYLTRPYVMAKNAAYSGWSVTSLDAYRLLSPSWQQNPLAYTRSGLATLKTPQLLDYRGWKGFYLLPDA